MCGGARSMLLKPFSVFNFSLTGSFADLNGTNGFGVLLMYKKIICEGNRLALDFGYLDDGKTMWDKVVQLLIGATCPLLPPCQLPRLLLDYLFLYPGACFLLHTCLLLNSMPKPTTCSATSLINK